MTHEQVVTIDCKGSLTTIYDDDLHELYTQGDTLVRRASHVEPEAEGCAWTADLMPVSGPILGPFPTRQAALDAERAWIIEHI